jgi:hypothetical protein
MEHGLYRPTGPMYFFLSSLPLLSPAITAVFGSYRSSFSRLTLYRGVHAGLPIKMIGEVSWEPKKEDEHGPLIFDSLMM